ncbi:ABC transporter permease [Dactylosporangium sp. NPDC051484]|uniref:ABC transporter permease n=1 Tax=Dactylosporangium sp. NPDC051484 TaxID=3154942 RepID=UPI0034501254
MAAESAILPAVAARAAEPSRLAMREFRYWLLRYRRTWRGTIVVSVANPLLFLIAIGVGLGAIIRPSSTPGGVPYLAFFAPGMLAASAMQNGVVESAFPISRAKRPGGSYQVATATPLEPTDIMVGHLMFMALRVAMSAFIFAAVMIAFGAARSPLVMLTPFAAVLTALAFATPVMAWAVTLPNPRPVNTAFKWVVMPLYLFSGTFFAVEQLPEWLRWLAYVTPLWQGVQLCRTLSLGTATWTGAAVHVAYLVVLTVVGLLIARRTYRRYLHP